MSEGTRTVAAATPAPVAKAPAAPARPLGPQGGYLDNLALARMGGDRPTHWLGDPLGNQAQQRRAVQAKLEVGRSDDPLEAEADQLAERAVNQSAPCACGATCDTCSAGTPKIRRKAAGPASGTPHVAATLGAGHPIEASTRGFFEERFGRDFSDVRIHSDKNADRSAANLRAHAYTAGRDIVFRGGKYAPQNSDGKRLLAHELAHVVQQESTPAQSVIRRENEDPSAVVAEDPNEELVVPAGREIPHDSRTLVNDKPYLVALLKKVVIEEKEEKAAEDFVQGFRTAYPALPGGVPEEGSELAFAHEVLGTLEDALRTVQSAAKTFKADFTNMAKNTLDAMLADSEKRINEEKEKYGLAETHVSVDEMNMGVGGNNAGQMMPATYGSVTQYSMNNDLRTQGMAGAARDLSAKRGEIAELQQRRAALDSSAGASSGSGGPGSEDAEIEAQRAEAEKRSQILDFDRQIEEKELQLKILRQMYETKYPILAAFATNSGDSFSDDQKKLQDLDQVGSGPGPETTALLLSVIEERLTNITKVRDGFPEKGDVWKLPTVIAAALQVNGYSPDSFEGALASGYMDEANDDFTGLVLTVLSIGLGLALAIPSGGASIGVMAASGAVVALDIAQIYRDVEKYELQVAAANTDFDRARSVASEEPSLFWLALSIVVTVAGDIAQLKTIFQGVKIAVTKALSGTAATLAKDTAEVAQAVRVAGGTQALEEALVRQVTKAVEGKGGARAAETIAGALGEESRAVEKVAAEVVEGTKCVPSQSLKTIEVEAELEHLARSGALEGPPGFRRGKIGEHEWIENGPGRWCRYSSNPMCVILNEGTADLNVAGKLGPDTVGTAENKAVMFQEYQSRGGLASFDEFSKAYDETVEGTATAVATVVRRDVRAYRGMPQGALPAEHVMDERLIVEMPFVGQGASKTNAAGFLRDHDYYWNEMIARYPEAFSETNLRRIRGLPPHPKPRAPIVDEEFRAVFKQYDVEGLRSKQLIHHHVAGGGQAAAVPSPYHPGYGGIHNTEKAAGIWGADDPIADMLQRMLEAEQGVIK
jgi:hypothetical protein